MAACLHPDVCVIFDAYRLDDFTRRQYARHAAAMEGVCRTVLVLHSRKVPAGPLPADMLLLRDEDIFDLRPCPKGASRRLIPGNCDLKTLAAIEALEGYERYISIEFDVLCIGDLRASLLQLIEAFRGYDLAGSYISDPVRTPDWMWWPSLAAPEGVDFDPALARKSFLPLSAYSRRLATVHRAALDAGWMGHQEVLWPTLAAREGMRILDISRLPQPLTTYPQFRVHAPEQLDVPSLPPFLHPVKTVEALDTLRERLNLPADW